jgi:HK97 family phage major capsid protein
MLEVINRSAADAALTFRAQARAERAKLLDTTVTLNAEEIRTIEAASAALEARAAAVAGFTPEREIEAQGGLGDGTQIRAEGTPENPQSQGRSVSHLRRVQALTRSIEDEFGGPNSLILALAKRQIEPLTPRQIQVVQHIRTITAETGGDSGAEFLLPLQQIESIFMQPMEVGGMYQWARRFTVRGRSLRIPYLSQGTGTTNRPMAGGIADVTIVGEGEAKPELEPKILQRLLNIYKWAAYTEIADETLADDMTGELAPTIQNVIGGQIVNTVNEYITIDGDGTDEPLGAFHPNNPSLLVVARETADTVTINDLFNMYAQHIIGPQSAWFIHPSALPSFMKLSLSGNTLVTWMTNLQNKPQMQLLGLPIVMTPLVNVLGDQGDVCLGNGAFYAMALRQALTIQSSIHYRFRNDLTAYRFFMRAGGVPIPDGTYSYKAAASVKEWPLSAFVVLGDPES